MDLNRHLLKVRIQAALDRRPGMDEMDLCVELNEGLRNVSEACDELVAEKKIGPMTKSKEARPKS